MQWSVQTKPTKEENFLHCHCFSNCTKRWQRKGLRCLCQQYNHY